MRAFWLGLGLAMFVATVSAQEKPAGGERRTPRTLTLTGCVEQGANPNQFTLTDALNGKFQVSGNRIGRYLGRRVEIAGNPDTRRLKVRLGLYPTPNVAAQAGAIDPVRAAIAAQPGGSGSGTGDVALPALKVKSIKTLDGGCR